MDRSEKQDNKLAYEVLKIISERKLKKIVRDTVLVVDDNEINREILQSMLEKDYEVVQASNGREALDVLRKISVSAIILDVVMPVMDGYEFMEEFSKIPEYRNIPVIMVTGEGDYEMKALESGAWDFVAKPYTAKILLFRLRNAIMRSSLEFFEQIKYLAEYDTMTGIYNRNKFYGAVEAVLKEIPDKEFAVICLDIDRFKLINAYFGREQGDVLLKDIAKSLFDFKEHCNGMIVGRIDADIFGICIPVGCLQSFVKYVEDVFKGYGKKHDYNIVCNMGIYEIKNRAENVGDMMDKAMLANKKNKGNAMPSFMYYDDEMSRRMEIEQEILNDMHKALENREFSVFYQPQYRLKDEKLMGAEALVRWIHPVKGFVSPGDFVPVFEHNGFIVQMDYYVWDTVCRDIRKWIDDGKPFGYVSINISRVNLYRPTFVDTFLNLVKKYRIDPEYLHLEITESAYTENQDVLKETVSILQKNGFRIMMDDFGSGYSTLNVFKEMPVDVLKMDMRFMDRLTEDERSRNIVYFIINMAKSLGINVVAEGVETKEQAEYLKKMGCEYAQGYYYSKPLSKEAYEKLMNDEK